MGVKKHAQANINKNKRTKDNKGNDACAHKNF